MARLHTVNKSPFERNVLESCLRFAKKGSTILFIEDGVTAVLKQTSVAAKIAQAASDFRLCVLAPDVSARGFDESNIMDGIESVDYAGFVDLVAEHDNVQAWL